MIQWDISFLNDAWLLGRNKQVQLKDVPTILQKDLMTFMFGKTVEKNENGILIGQTDYRAWLSKLNIKGFDYDIQLEPKM